jgi:phosphatidylserine decarboxylase
MSDQPSAIRYRDRARGVIEAERVFGGDSLRWLYGRRHGRLLTDLLLTRRTLNHFYGWRQRSPKSRAKIAEFVSSLGIDATEAELPLEDYRSLDDFFTRRLRAGARPIDSDPRHLVAPADARLLVQPRLDGATLAVKGSRVGVPELLGDRALAARFAGGTAYIFRLAPADYHRFHFPDDGDADEARSAGRALHSVHPIALAAGAPSFRNRRMVTLLRTRGFGAVAMVEVGALLVGTIVQTYRPGQVARGVEKGMFRFGGSTVVLLCEPGRVEVDPDLVEWSTLDRPSSIETLVRMGTAIGRVP